MTTKLKSKHISNLWGSVKSKLNTTLSPKTNAHSCDDFIIKYNQRNQHNENQIDIDSLDRRRVVFVSLIGFYQTWDKCPSLILYSCLLLMPLKREWIYNPHKYMDELKACFISQLSIFSDPSKLDSFIKLLKWKDSQSLTLWMLDDEQLSEPDPSGDSLVAPFWFHASRKLTALCDPVTGNKYKPLNLKKIHWENKNYFNGKYNVKKIDILKELFFVTMKFKAMQEIIHESNPNSLSPITFYGETNHVSKCHKKTSPVYNGFDEEEVENWWISQDYN